MSFSIPGKTFILGEYAILGGLPALVAAVPPRFSLQPGPSVPAPFHPESPAGKLLSGTRSSPDFPFVFHDPLEGAGGFGASTAQFALSYYAVAHAEGWSLAWQDVWKKYRELSTGSGADLMTQWLGGIVRCQVSPGGVPSVEAMPEVVPRFGQSKGFHWSDLMIFSASHQTGRKTATHHHLDALKGEPFTRVLEKLRAPLDAGFAAIQKGDGVQLGQALGDYADVLKEAGLEIEPTFRDRQALSKIPGVLGVKGTGANQSDAIIVLADSNPRYKEQITEAALSRGLKLVSSGLTMENGIQSL